MFFLKQEIGHERSQEMLSVGWSKKGLTLSDLFVVIAIVGMKRAVLARTRPTVAGKKASLGAHKPAVFFDLNHPDVWPVTIFSCQGLVCAWPQLFF